MGAANIAYGWLSANAKLNQENLKFITEYISFLAQKTLNVNKVT